jgi:hypothetical protein
MSCGFCHVGPNPVKPPVDAENPKWENLSSNVGAQYLWVERVLAWDSDMKKFPIQLFHTSRPGTLDTSLISSDNINNPRTMNAVYDLPERMGLKLGANGLEEMPAEAGMALRWGTETLSGGQHDNKQLNDFIHSGVLTKFYESPDTVKTPRVLKDGSDSVGVLGALNRVYLNIGLFSEEWFLHFRPLVGGKAVSPIPIATANKNSVYWQVTQQQTPDMALFFLQTTQPHLLRNAPGGPEILHKSEAHVDRGKTVFAERCARCHSSKIPAPAAGLDPGGCSGKDYLTCWNKYWAWTKTEEFKSQMRTIVHRPDFLENNYLSTDQRVPVTLLQTNACSPLATNAIRGNIWDNFSSETYKDLPSVGSITYYHPYSGEANSYTMPAGGRGYTRPASLISLWTSAPYLLNNSVGQSDDLPGVTDRVEAFQESMNQMLWPEKRQKDSLLPQLPGTIDRTTETSYLTVPAGYLPDLLQPLLGLGARLFPAIFGPGEVRLGPIPKGTPVDLLANLDLLGEGLEGDQKSAHQKKVLDLLLKMQHDLGALPSNATDDDARRVFANLVPDLLALSKCPDYVVNRGHYFGTSAFAEEPGLNDDDKHALIAFLETF